MLDWRMTKLLKLLARERDLLVGGDLVAAAQLSPEKERLAEKLDFARADKGALRQLHDAAERNERLIAAARDGISAARERLRQIRQGPTVRTYSATGLKETIRPIQTSLQKRA
ncbi:hypothetical protein [Palleronia sp. LCG004]|uniref:hypothetical protein n=1 Tax=Palleronia sp. LCG004 TaxID=3079304 RepID=UPI002942E3E4|nr:hypothetical protein [Palleronia sp. LCG004]WOI56204.1 hypothetical protein RVY76_14425 [Palleronia sp. LCG004]